MAKSKAVPKELPRIHVGPVSLAVNNRDEGVSSTSYGDEIIQLDSRDSRFDVANDLRMLARVIAQTGGRKLASASIAVLLRFERPVPAPQPKPARRKR